MPKRQSKTVAPDPTWATPASTWSEAISRYTTFLQVPTWRASVKRDGHEKAACWTTDEAARLRDGMVAALTRLAGGRHLAAKPQPSHLADLWMRQGRSTPRRERCPTKLQTHFQRAFLLNAAGYKCCYCGRTAWGVYEEACASRTPRTLRFEVDHLLTRQRLQDRTKFDPANIVAACRSCNVIKAEMPVDQFLCELESIGRAVHMKQASGVTV
jgi:5-methylcytosine-specific restriction endonuclease McrA